MSGSNGQVRPFVMWPDKRLGQVAEPVAEITDEIRAHWADMVATMEAMPGVGLAAPQIGLNLRLAVVDCSEERGRAVLLANPELLQVSKETHVVAEASPNLPGLHAKITRPRVVTVKFLNAQGVWDRKDFEDLWATSVQHQIDHLNGKLYFDRLSRVKRDMLLRKAAKR